MRLRPAPRSFFRTPRRFLPMLPVELRDLETADDGVKVVEAAQVHGIVIGGAARIAEHLHAAVLAEEMFRRQGVELVEADRFRAAQNPEALMRDAMIDSALLRADRAVALRPAPHLGF